MMKPKAHINPNLRQEEPAQTPRCVVHSERSPVQIACAVVLIALAIF
jgi:hypothetical protein